MEPIDYQEILECLNCGRYYTSQDEKPSCPECGSNEYEIYDDEIEDDEEDDYE